jgi:hypothetical protein
MESGEGVRAQSMLRREGWEGFGRHDMAVVVVGAGVGSDVGTKGAAAGQAAQQLVRGGNRGGSAWAGLGKKRKMGWAQ